VLDLRGRMSADGTRTATEAARHVRGVDAAAGAASLGGDEVALGARILDRRFHLRVLQIEILVAQVRELVGERQHSLVAHIGLGFLDRFFLRLRLVGLRFLLRLRRRWRWRRFRLLDDELGDALAHVLGLHAFGLALRQQEYQDRQQGRDDQQDAQQLLELALALFLERPRQLEAAEKWSESDTHAPAPTSRSR
jgi:hypothetical protein